MITAYSAAAIRAAEEASGDLLESGELMRRAARGLAKVAAARAERGEVSRIVGLVGPGNNGADTLWALARLAKRFEVVAICLTDDLTPAQRPPAKKLRRREGRVLTGVGADDAEALEAIGEAGLVLDGLTGIGGRPGLPDPAKAWVAAIAPDAYVLAVDCPSGQPVEGGASEADGVFADETVSFAAPTPGLLLPPTSDATGVLTVIDIGIDLGGSPPAAFSLDDGDVASLWPAPGGHDDKYSRGVLGVIAGGEHYTGAALLSVTAAVEAGAGMVRYLGTATPTGLLRQQVPETVFGEGRVQAWVIGPGLEPRSRAAGAAAQIRAAREALDSAQPVLLDAGGLDLIPTAGLDREGETLLTPHAGECARLLTRLTGEAVQRSQVEADPVRHAHALAEASGATVLLKGAATVVVGPEGDELVWAQSAAPSWLATAGAGDVLAGLIGTLLAAGLPAATAGALGAHVHGRAADHANPGGPVRALAVARAIPGTVARLL